MRTLTLCLVLVLSSCFAIAQTDTLSKAITIKLPTTFKKAALVNEVEIPAHADEAGVTVDIKGEFWDTTVYNPYKNTVAEFPLNVKFDDSTYASPISRKKVITSRYGWRRGRPHKGIDIDLITGDSVSAILDGIVRFARYSRGHGKVDR